MESIKLIAIFHSFESNSIGDGIVKLKSTKLYFHRRLVGVHAPRFDGELEILPQNRMRVQSQYKHARTHTHTQSKAVPVAAAA